MSTAAEFKTANRSHTSLLAGIEKRTLIWIASRLPAWVNSDHLTGLGFVSLVAAGGAYWYSKDHALALLAVIVLLALTLGHLRPSHAAEPDVPTLLQTAEVLRDAIAQFLYPQPDWRLTLFSLAGHPHLQHVKVTAPDVTQYAALLGGGQ